MFNIFKPKVKTAIPTFAPLEVDIHSHILPGVDDGSKSNEESIVCMQVMHDAGFKNIICTPHYQYPRFPNEESDILNRYDNLKLDIMSIKPTNIPQFKGVAGEYRVDSGFSQRIEQNKFLLVGNRFLLIEFSLHQQVMGLEQIMFDIQMKNHEIILAHPERYPYYSSSAPKLQQFKDMGVYFQVNILSLEGYFGRGARETALWLIDNNLCDMLGSDMHSMDHAHIIQDYIASREWRKLCEKYDLPKRIINDREFVQR